MLSFITGHMTQPSFPRPPCPPHFEFVTSPPPSVVRSSGARWSSVMPHLVTHFLRHFRSPVGGPLQAVRPDSPAQPVYLSPQLSFPTLNVVIPTFKSPVSTCPAFCQPFTTVSILTVSCFSIPLLTRQCLGRKTKFSVSFRSSQFVSLLLAAP